MAPYLHAGPLAIPGKAYLVREALQGDGGNAKTEGRSEI